MDAVAAAAAIDRVATNRVELQMNVIRALAVSAAVLAGGAALSGCTPSMATTDARSVAVVEQFFGHLEAGEATAAAELTTAEFPAELVDDDFYAASVATPSNARIVETDGYDAGPFTATVDYVLDDPAQTVSLEITVGTADGERRITRWGQRDRSIAISSVPAAGVIEINGIREYTLAEARNKLALLPGVYALTYADPTGLLELNGDDETSFTVRSPGAEQVRIAPTFRPDVAPAVRAEVERLQSACEDEDFIGPSCPSELVEAMEFASADGAVSGEWFRESGPDLVLIDQGYESRSTYLFHSKQLPMNVIGSYTGAVTRDASGAVVFTR